MKKNGEKSLERKNGNNTELEISKWGKSESGEGLEISLFKLELIRKTEEDFIIHVKNQNRAVRLAQTSANS